MTRTTHHPHEKGNTMSNQLAALHNSLLSVLDEHEKTVTRVREDLNAGFVTEPGAKDAIAKAAARGNWLGRISQVETAVTDWIDRATTDVAKARAKLTTPEAGTATEQLLAETRATRAWDRLRRTLDAADEVTAFFKAIEAVKTASGDELRVLLDELGPYLDMRNGDGQAEQEIDAALVASKADYGRAVAYLHTAQQTAAWLGTAATILRDHVLSIVPGAHRAAEIDLQVRGIARFLTTAEGAGERTEINGRWDSALQEFQR